MFLIAKILDLISNSYATYEQRRREAWLSESSDIAELEHRMRSMERAETQNTAFGHSIRID